MGRNIPFYSIEYIHQDLEKDLIESFCSTLKNNRFVLGKKLEEFEEVFAEYIGTRYSIGVGNGYDALKIGLKSLDLPDGSEVIVPALTFTATILAVMHADLKPVLVDIGPKNYLIEPRTIEKQISSKTRVILPVHMYGTPCPMDDLLRIANSHKIILMEDFAQSVGAEINKKKTGSFGKINAGSFYPVKTLGALGDGGIITTDDEYLAKNCRIWRNYGYRNKYHQEFPGFNSRLDEIQAVFLLKKLGILDQQIRERKRIAHLYFKYLNGNNKLILPEYPDDKKIRSAHHIFPIRTQNRDRLMIHLKKTGIDTQIHYPIPPHLQNALHSLGYSTGDFPVTEEICKTELSLPVYPGLTDDDVKYICKQINDF